ncbi:hypothetical protein H0E87_020669, partial [Populus deltoides]
QWSAALGFFSSVRNRLNLFEGISFFSSCMMSPCDNVVDVSILCSYGGFSSTSTTLSIVRAMEKA